MNSDGMSVTRGNNHPDRWRFTCPKCRGCGRVVDPSRRWWQFWRTIYCRTCLGFGWIEMRRTK